MNPVIPSLTANLGLSALEAQRLCNSATPLPPFCAGSEIISTAGTRGARLILNGWACEMRLLFDGRRQIFSFLMPGDVCLVRPHWPRGGLSVIALTSVTCLDLSDERIQGGAATLLSAARLNEARRYEAALRLGRLNASERIVHLLLELRDRMEVAGLTKGDCLTLPLTQNQLADALGLSLVYVNRTLTSLRRQALLTFGGGKLTLLQPGTLALMAMRER